MNVQSTTIFLNFIIFLKRCFLKILNYHSTQPPSKSTKETSIVHCSFHHALQDRQLTTTQPCARHCYSQLPAQTSPPSTPIQTIWRAATTVCILAGLCFELLRLFFVPVFSLRCWAFIFTVFRKISTQMPLPSRKLFQNQAQVFFSILHCWLVLLLVKLC